MGHIGILNVYSPPPSADVPPPAAPCAFAIASRLKLLTHCICFSKTFHSLMVLSFVEMRKRALFAPWWHHRSVGVGVGYHFTLHALCFIRHTVVG
jgi:hypothetical protein